MTEPQPLKGNMKMFHNGKVYHDDNDVASAVEWLKNEIDDLYHAYGKVNVWGKNQDVLCDDLEDFFKRKIDEAFADVVVTKR